jgi:hypothetical protein
MLWMSCRGILVALWSPKWTDTIPWSASCLSDPRTVTMEAQLRSPKSRTTCHSCAKRRAFAVVAGKIQWNWLLCIFHPWPNDDLVSICIQASATPSVPSAPDGGTHCCIDANRIAKDYFAAFYLNGSQPWRSWALVWRNWVHRHEIIEDITWTSMSFFCDIFINCLFHPDLFSLNIPHRLWAWI